MKKYIISYILFLYSLPGIAQLIISAGANWVSDGNVSVSIQNINFVNNGNFHAGTGSVKFTGNQSSTINGNNLALFNILEIAKSNGSKVSLNRNISINSSLSFITGQLDLNGNSILMGSSAMVAGESEINRIIGPNGGFIEITQTMNAPASVNAGNLGATITSSADLGAVTVRRTHQSLTGIGLTSSINRNYLISPANNNNLDATLRLKYFDAELNGQNENTLVMYQSFSTAGGWNNLSQTIRNSNANYIEKTGLASLALQTLANDNVIAPDGATGVLLTGQRKKATEVTLKWISQAETNMSGYQVQRKLKNETDFSDRTFVNSSAQGGNSTTSLLYQNIDENSYTDTSFYRLKIITTNNTFTYSNVIAVAGKTKGPARGDGNGNSRDTEELITSANANPPFKSNPSAQKITVGPNPNNGNFWFSVNGLKKETIATLFTIDGKEIRQFRVVNLQQQKVSAIKTGIYLLKVPGFETQKIIVNGGSNGITIPNQTTNNSKL